MRVCINTDDLLIDQIKSNVPKGLSPMHPSLHLPRASARGKTPHGPGGRDPFNKAPSTLEMYVFMCVPASTDTNLVIYSSNNVRKKCCAKMGGRIDCYLDIGEKPNVSIPGQH